MASKYFQKININIFNFHQILLILSQIICFIDCLNNDNKIIANKNCTCVPFYQCTDIEDGFLITDGTDLIDTRCVNKYCI